MNSKWKNYGLWLSVLSLAGLLIKPKLQIGDAEWDNLVNSVLAILVTLGIVSNPSLGKGYIDIVDK